MTKDDWLLIGLAILIIMAFVVMILAAFACKLNPGGGEHNSCTAWIPFIRNRG